MLNEVGELAVVRGGAAALYGEQATAGAVLVEPAHPVTDVLLTRAVAEEGVDDYLRGAFQLARRVGDGASVFLSTETRRIDGFFPGTKQVDRHFAGTLQARLPGRLEMSAGYRRYEGDGRHRVDETFLPVQTKRGDYHLEMFRAHSPDGRGGALLELGLLRERLENRFETAEQTVREIVSPSARVTLDLPATAGWRWTARGEAVRWRIEREDLNSTSRFWRGAAALRGTRSLGAGRRLTGTVRLDTEEGRKRALQARLETGWTVGAGTAFAIASRNERIPDRGAQGADNEVHDSATVGYRWDTDPFRARAAAFGTRIRHYRREATFEESRAREPVLDAPLGTATVRGASLGIGTGRFAVPGIRALGAWTLASSVTALGAENDDTGERLPRRPRFTWTGEGTLERRFFRDELLARVRGRMTHWRDRVDDDGAEVPDLWITDVLLEGEIGDAIFFYRFHDLLERADAIEPGYRFPGFSRIYGLSWRFWG